MFTRMTFSRLMHLARRVTGRNACKVYSRLSAALLLALAMGVGALAADATPGVIRVSDQPLKGAVVPAGGSVASAAPAAPACSNGAVCAVRGPARKLRETLSSIGTTPDLSSKAWSPPGNGMNTIP